MKTVKNLSGKIFVLLLLLMFIFSCSKENIEDSLEPTVDVLQMEALSSTADYFGAVSCVGSNYGGNQTKSAYVSVGNGAQAKTLTAYISNSANEIVVYAFYLATVKNQDLKATVTITIGGISETFSGVNPQEYVSSSFDLASYSEGSTIPITIEQKVFLEPVVISFEYDIVPACPPVIGESRYGGIVAYIFQQGEDGFVEGETHGIVASSQNLPMSDWSTAITNSQNLELNGYDDWYLPSADELLKVRENINFSSNDSNVFDPSFWSSTEESELSASAVSVIALVSPDYYITSFPKSSILDVRPVRKF